MALSLPFKSNPAVDRGVIPVLSIWLALVAGLAFLSPSPAQTVPSAPTARAADDDLVRLGEQLFQSPLFSADESVSCRTCHIPSLGFSGDRPLAIGVAGHVSARRAPSLLGLKDAKSLMWDGRAADLRNQIAIPLESPEMATVWPTALSRLRTDPTVSELAGRAGLASIDRGSALAALAAYVASLDAGNSRFDRYYFNQDTQALTTQEAWGLRLFIRKGRCANCHLVDSRGAPFTDNAFHRTGIGRVEGLYKDRGRAAITGDPVDEGAFKTPGLRGVALRPYLMHDGSVSSLRQAVEHYNERITEGSPMLDERLATLHLTGDEVDAIVAFLGTLTPENAAVAPNSAAVR